MTLGKNKPRAKQSDLAGWVRFVTSTLVLSVLMASGMMFSQHLARLESVTLMAPGQPTIQRDRPHPGKHSINVKPDGSLVFDDFHNQNDISSTDADEMRIPESELWQPADPSVVAQMPKSRSSSKSARKKRRKEKKPLFSKVGVYGRGFTTVFLHIHKAGGTTLCYLARKREKAIFDPNCNLNNRPDRLTLAAGTAEEFSAVVDKFRDEGNRTFLASEWFLPAQLPKRQDIKYITMLRNPLARMESHFHMAFEQAARVLKSTPKLKNCRYAESLPSWQTIRLIDEDIEVASSTRELFALYTPDNWQTRAVCGPACAQVPFGKLTEEHFQIAKDRLENDFAIVGIIEHFQETITMFHGLLQWDGEVSDIFSEHHGTHHGGITVLKRLELEAAGNPRLQNFAKWWHAVNQFDIQLYNIGRELFRKQAIAEGLTVKMGPDISLDFVAPQGEVTPAAALRSMLEADVNARKCTTQCCSQDCAPIGRFWHSTAIDLGMAPRQRC